METVIIIDNVPEIFREALKNKLTEMGFKNTYPGDKSDYSCISISKDLETLFAYRVSDWKKDHYFIEGVYGVNNVVGFLDMAARYVKEAQNPKILIGSYEVIFKKDGLNVGCQFVSWETFDKIIKKREELKEQNIRWEQGN